MGKHQSTDPAVVFLQDILSPQIRSGKIKITKLAEKSGLNYRTVYKIIFGETNCPQHRTIVLLQSAVGIYYHRKYYPEQVVDNLPLAQAVRQKRKYLTAHKEPRQYGFNFH